VEEMVTDINVPNDKDIMPLIMLTFDAAYKSLPETMPAIGRVNKWAAYASRRKMLHVPKGLYKALRF